MKMKFSVPLMVASAMLCFEPHPAFAQNYVEEQGRFQFAQTYIGADLLYFPDIAGLTVLNDPTFGEIGIPDGFSPRLTIGGLHFWGHADFYVSFPLTSTIFVPTHSDDVIYSGVETGFHFYPWRLEYNTIRPFVGISWNVFAYQRHFDDVTEGARINIHRFPLIGGVSWHNQWGQIDLTARYALNSEFDYYVTETTVQEYRVLPFSVALGYKFIFDTTERSEPRLAQEEARGTKLREQGRLSGISIGAGPSSAITLSSFDSGKSERAHLNRAPNLALNPEFSVGYHIYDIDAEFRFAYRYIYVEQEAGFGVEQQFRRHAVSLEFVKFIADYQGFVPFVGLGAEYNHLYYRERSDNSIEVGQSAFNVPIVFGWDIRPIISTSWLLRTTLRYNPLTHLEARGNDIPFDHLEFNFIQFVLYPDRL